MDKIEWVVTSQRQGLKSWSWLRLWLWFKSWLPRLDGQVCGQVCSQVVAWFELVVKLVVIQHIQRYVKLKTESEPCSLKNSYRDL